MTIFRKKVGLQKCVLCKGRSVDPMIVVKTRKVSRGRYCYPPTLEYKCICQQCVEQMAETLGLPARSAT